MRIAGWALLVAAAELRELNRTLEQESDPAAGVAACGITAAHDRVARLCSRTRAGSTPRQIGFPPPATLLPHRGSPAQLCRSPRTDQPGHPRRGPVLRRSHRRSPPPRRRGQHPHRIRRRYHLPTDRARRHRRSRPPPRIAAAPAHRPRRPTPQPVSKPGYVSWPAQKPNIISRLMRR
jgi:hypothetical protein